MALSESELSLSEQTSILEKPERKISQVDAQESIQEEVLAVKNSLETGQLSKLLIEVRLILLHGEYVFFPIKLRIETSYIKFGFEFRMLLGRRKILLTFRNIMLESIIII